MDLQLIEGLWSKVTAKSNDGNGNEREGKSSILNIGIPRNIVQLGRVGVPQ